MLLRVRRREPQSGRQNRPTLRVVERSGLNEVAGASPADVRAGGLTNAVRAAGAVVRCATGDLNKPGTRRPAYAAHLSDVRRPPAAVQACRRTDTGRARRARGAKRARHPEAGAGGYSSIPRYRPASGAGSPARARRAGPFPSGCAAGAPPRTPAPASCWRRAAQPADSDHQVCRPSR